MLFCGGFFVKSKGFTDVFEIARNDENFTNLAIYHVIWAISINSES